MPLLSWDNKFSVEVQSIDKQHQKLFETLNELHDAMQAGKGRRLAPAILERLVEYTREHFAAEEALMKQADYPDFASHKAEHDKLKNEVFEVVRMVKDFEDGIAALMLSGSLLDFLRDWLQSHILNSDKSFTAHLRTAGIR